MLKTLIFLAVSSFSITCLGTTFVPVPITTQLKEADGVVYAEVLSKDSELMDDQMIVTRYGLRLNKWIGLENFEGKEIDVLTPGGNIGNKGLQIEGTAQMSVGEKVVLLLGKDEKQRFWVRNLGLGKYSAKKIGNSVVLVNQIFPMHPQIGQIKLENFFSIAERVKNEQFQERFKDKYEIQGQKQMEGAVITKTSARRSIASVEEAADRSGKGLNTFWLIIILGAMGGWVAFWRNRSTEK